MDSFTETIKCPECGTVQKAEVEFTLFGIYIHRCTNCGFIILESDWEVVDGEKTN